MESFLRDNLLELREALWNNKYSITRNAGGEFSGPHRGKPSVPPITIPGKPLVVFACGIVSATAITPVLKFGGVIDRYVHNVIDATSTERNLIPTLHDRAGVERAESNEIIMSGDYATSDGKYGAGR